jgi:DNA phosphorothioation-dependent restriction protein DptH
MAKRLSAGQRREILDLLAQGHDRETIAARVGVTPGQVSAISAHVTMGTYAAEAQADLKSLERAAAVLKNAPVSTQHEHRIFEPVLIGKDAESGEPVDWNPDPKEGSANPHVLVLGESGFGKTYAICCLLTELAQRGIASVVFDYAQGFSLENAPSEFIKFARPVELDAARDGININPLQAYPFDLHGPISVAQRVADTFRRVYPGIGIQQHAVLREAVLDVLTAPGQPSKRPKTQIDAPPPFSELQRHLEDYANDPTNPNRKLAATVASHISTVFVFDTFRSNGQTLEWNDMLRSQGRTFVIRLRGLEHSLEKAVTEFLLWNFIGFIESLGPGPLRSFVVLDEAHKLSFDSGSPAEKLLREGRKFGLGVILASQQPEDFSSVAFANSATKLIFQVGDENSSISRQIHRKIRNAHSFNDIYEIVTKLPRGWAYVVTENVGRVVSVTSLEERVKQWRR